MMNRLAFALLLLFGCADRQSTTDQPELSGDVCAPHNDKTTCGADRGCIWFDYGRPCPANDTTCPGGVCQGSSSGSGSGGAGSGSSHAACACPAGGVCFDQIGGTVQPSGGPEIQCTAVPADGDRCAQIDNQGHCSASANVTGLCICDNGVR